MYTSLLGNLSRAENPHNSGSSNVELTLAALSECVGNVHTWMIVLEQRGKKRILVLVSQHHLQLVGEIEKANGSALISPSDHVTNFGIVTFPADGKMRAHDSHVCRSANYYIRNIRSFKAL